MAPSELGEINVFRRFSSERTEAMRLLWQRARPRRVPPSAPGSGQMIRYPVGAGDGSRAALARDPDGEWVELVVLPNPTDAELTRFEIGLTVADLDASRAFYRDLIGLVESGPVYDDLLGTQKYTYRHGATTINLWTFGRDLPSDAETAGMQYIVWNVAGVDEVARKRGATIDRPLSARHDAHRVARRPRRQQQLLCRVRGPGQFTAGRVRVACAAR